LLLIPCKWAMHHSWAIPIYRAIKIAIISSSIYLSWLFLRTKKDTPYMRPIVNSIHKGT
jgi:hypothetical protein